MAKEKMRMPMGMGGLVRYFDDYKSKIEFRPIVVVIVVILVIIIEIWLHARGG
jgi:preprotein translocase subunit Sec61beta